MRKNKIQPDLDKKSAKMPRVSTLSLPDHFFNKVDKARSAFAKRAQLAVYNHLKNYFLPTETNGFRPHLHHPHRLAKFGAGLIGMKILIAGILLLPYTQAFAAADVLSEQKSQVVVQTNGLRTSKGLSTLAVSSALSAAAQAKAEDMASKQYFGHQGPDGNRLAYWLAKYGYSYSLAGENLAMGFATANGAMQGWINSSTHYANLVDARYTEFGVGAATGTYEGKTTIFLVQHFGQAKTVTTSPVPALIPNASASETEVQPVEVTPMSHPAVIQQPDQPKPVTVSQTPAQPIVYDANNSRVVWEETGDEVVISAEAAIEGKVAKVEVLVGSLDFELIYNSQSGLYEGEMLMPNTVTETSSALTVPTIKITSPRGQVLSNSIDWAEVRALTDDAETQYKAAQTEKAEDWWVIEFMKWVLIAGLIVLNSSTGYYLIEAWKAKRPHAELGMELVGMVIVIVSLAIV